MPKARPQATAKTGSATAASFRCARAGQWAPWLLLPTLLLLIITGSHAAFENNRHNTAVVESEVLPPGVENPGLNPADVTDEGYDNSDQPHHALPTQATRLNPNPHYRVYYLHLNPSPTTPLSGSIAARAPPEFTAPDSPIFIF